jgi:hypothetical protein
MLALQIEQLPSDASHAVVNILFGLTPHQG